MYAKKHVESRWLTMKYVAVRMVEQWANMKEYFLKFLPQQKGFKQLQKSDRYERIETALKDNSSLAYISFCAFIAQEFEGFLLPFQSEEPMIHLLYPEMCKLLTNIMRKFIRNKYADQPPPAGLHTVDVTKEKYQKPLNLIDIGTKAKVLFSNVSFLPSEEQKKFREDCFDFYVMHF